MKGNAFWVGKGASGYSITSVVDGEGMPHGRKWQSDNLRPGDIGISLRLDMKNQPEMSADQKKVLAEQVKLFSEQALQFLGQEPVQSFFVAPGDFVVPDKEKPDWLGQVIKADQLGVTLHRLDWKGPVNWETFKPDMNSAPIVFTPWNQLQVVKIAKTFQEVFKKTLGRFKQLDLSEIFADHEADIIDFLLDTDPDFSVDQLDMNDFENWYVVQDHSAEELFTVRGFDQAMRQSFNNYSIWEHSLGLVWAIDDVDELFLEKSLSTSSRLNVHPHKDILEVISREMSTLEKIKLARKITNQCLDPSKDSILFDQKFVQHFNPSSVRQLITSALEGWKEHHAAMARLCIESGLKCNRDNASLNLLIKDRFEHADLDRVIAEYDRDLQKGSAGFEALLWKAMVERFAEVGHPCAQAMADYKF